jgi:tripartite-type tricarboxylate transporter receptor subunit TctC
MNRGIRGNSFGLLLIIPCFVLAVIGYSSAAEKKAKFTSKTVTFIVPTSPGGGFDTDARLLAPFLQKYLPGQPNIIVKNFPGGAWRLGITELYKSHPDGSAICIFNIPGNVVDQISGLAVRFNESRLDWQYYRDLHGDRFIT